MIHKRREIWRRRPPEIHNIRQKRWLNLSICELHSYQHYQQEDCAADEKTAYKGGSWQLYWSLHSDAYNVAIMQWLVDIHEPSYRWLWVWLHYCTNQFRPIHLIYDNSWTVTIDGCHVLSMNYSPFRSNRLYPRVLTGSVFLIFKFIMCLFTLISVCLCLFYLLFFGHTSLFL